MTDEELQKWWPELGTLIAELRNSKHSELSDSLVDAVRGATTSGELLDTIGVLLREHRRLRSTLNDPGLKAWNAVLGDVNRAFPGLRLAQWILSLIKIR